MGESLVIDIEFQKAVVALACLQATEGEHYRAALMVCQVLQNRAKRLGSDLYSQAAYLLGSTILIVPDPREPRVRDFLSNFDLVYHGLAADATDGSIYFFNTKTDCVPTGAPSATYGNLVFFR
jgi:hypothetical protein